MSVFDQSHVILAHARREFFDEERSAIEKNEEQGQQIEK